MTDLKELIERQKRWNEVLVTEAHEYYESVGPVEVEAVFGKRPVTFRVPFIHPTSFNDVADKFPPRAGVAVDSTLWFNLAAVARNYPGVTLVVDGEEDDLFRVRNKEAVYVWPELYDEMPPEDQQNFRMAVWSLNIWEPQQRRNAIKAREAEGVDNG